MFACFCVCVCVDTGTALENGEQEAHGVQKPGKTYPTIPSAVFWSAKASWSYSSTNHGLLVFSCLSALFTSFLFFSSVQFSLCVFALFSIISGLLEQDVSYCHYPPTSCQYPLQYKAAACSLFFTAVNLTTVVQLKRSHRNI